MHQRYLWRIWRYTMWSLPRLWRGPRPPGSPNDRRSQQAVCPTATSNPVSLFVSFVHFSQGVQRPELRRPFKHGGFLRPFYGVFKAVDKRPKLRPRKLWVCCRCSLSLSLFFVITLATDTGIERKPHGHRRSEPTQTIPYKIARDSPIFIGLMFERVSPPPDKIR